MMRHWLEQIDLIKWVPGQLVLVIGCAEGALCRALVARKLRVIGIDEDKTLIARARSLDEHALYKVMDAGELDYFDESFDAVLIDRTADEKVLQEAYRVLCTDGMLLALHEHPQSLHFYPQDVIECVPVDENAPEEDVIFLVQWRKQAV